MSDALCISGNVRVRGREDGQETACWSRRVASQRAGAMMPSSWPPGTQRHCAVHRLAIHCPRSRLDSLTTSYRHSLLSNRFSRRISVAAFLHHCSRRLRFAPPPLSDRSHLHFPTLSLLPPTHHASPPHGSASYGSHRPHPPSSSCSSPSSPPSHAPTSPQSPALPPPPRARLRPRRLQPTRRPHPAHPHRHPTTHRHLPTAATHHLLRHPLSTARRTHKGGCGAHHRMGSVPFQSIFAPFPHRVRMQSLSGGSSSALLATGFCDVQSTVRRISSLCWMSWS